MSIFAANLTMMFTEIPFMDRFKAAADAGFCAVEYLFPYAYPAQDIAKQLARFELTQALFNLPPGNWDAGERGLAALPERFDEFRDSVALALKYANATGLKRVHMMAGLADPADKEAAKAYRRALVYAGKRSAEFGINLLIEPINSRSIPGYFLNDFNMAEQFIKEIDLDNIYLQFDIFHRQIIHGDVTEALRRLMPVIGHIQVASVPSRNEPDGEELNFPFLFAELDRLGYSGFIGCEYNPRTTTAQGLGWFEPYRGRAN